MLTPHSALVDIHYSIYTLLGIIILQVYLLKIISVFYIILTYLFLPKIYCPYL